MALVFLHPTGCAIEPENHDNRNLVTVSYNLATVSGRVRRANLLEFDTHVCFLMVT